MTALPRRRGFSRAARWSKMRLDLGRAKMDPHPTRFVP
jgi:hypothetical protein